MPFAGIGDAQFHCFTLWLSAESQRPALRHCIHCVQNQVAQRAMQQFRIGVKRHGFGGELNLEAKSLRFTF
jgi:hypothetical protein